MFKVVVLADTPFIHCMLSAHMEMRTCVLCFHSTALEEHPGDGHKRIVQRSFTTANQSALMAAEFPV